MNKAVIKYEEMTKSLLGFLLNIEDTTYYVVNSHLNENTRKFILEALSYYQFEEMAKITITDIEKNTNAIQFAESNGIKLNEYLYEHS